MPRFSYSAKNTKGITQKGIVEAMSEKHALNLLHERGMFVIDIRENTLEIPLSRFYSTKVNFNDTVNFTRQLSAMLTAGLTLIEALSVIQQQLTKPSLVKMIGQIQDDVAGGKSFTQALERYPGSFPQIYLALVRAGEASGKLDVILDRLAENLEKSRDFKSKFRSALIYPAIVVIAMLSVAVIVMTVVVPKLTSLYKEFGADLPLPTLILISASNFMISSWWIAGVFIAGAIILFARIRKTVFGRHLLGKLSISVPVFGNLIRQATIVEMTRTLSILIDGGVPILTSLSIARSATGNILYQEAFEDCARRVEKGSKLSEPLIENSLFPPILGQMVAVGEQTGKLGDSLFRLSKYFEAETDVAVKSLTTVIEPLIMIVLGIGVAFLVMAVLLPIYTLTSKF